MSAAGDHTNDMVKSYSDMLRQLNVKQRLLLIAHLSQSIQEDDSPLDEAKFYKAFGAFPDDESPEMIIGKIRASRQFLHRDLAVS